MRRGSPGILRWLTLAALLALALAAPVVAVAAEPTSGYNQTPAKPSTGTSPSKAAKPPTPTPTPAPSKEPVPATTSVGAAKESKTLPFTGFDLRWSLAIGLLLMGAGFSIVAVQRRQRRRGES